jgi:hypothetical protein
MASIARDRSGRSARTDGASVVRIFATTACWEGAEKGDSPASIS